jgi:hypothetical protein
MNLRSGQRKPIRKWRGNRRPSAVKLGGTSMADQQALYRLAFGPRLRRLKALTGLAARPLLATKRSTTGSG